MPADSRARDRARTLAAGGMRMLIGGSPVAARSGSRYDVVDPATGDIVAQVPDAAEGDVDAAVSAAEESRHGWARRPAAERAAVVRAMADVAEQHLDDIAALDTLDTGVPLWMMRRDIATGIKRMRMFADWALRLTGETIPSTPTHLTYTERIPYGIVGRIVAYNHPAMFGISKIAAPLVAGNAVVLKPSEQTPLSMLHLGALWADTVPAGVLAVITGATPAPGARLVADPRVRRIAFTGSPATGRIIQRTAADAAVKHVSLELGGKNALVVLDDADPGAVVDGAIKGMNFAFAGQSCGSTSRVLVPSPMLATIVDRLAERFAGLRVGDPFDGATTVSPLISGTHHARVTRLVDGAVRAGARRVTAAGPLPHHGFFHAPTLLVETDPAATVATEEVFGPVLTVIPVRDAQQAVTIANSVRYGLTGSVYGGDVGRALGVAGQLDAGYVWVNDTSTHFDAVPFGGVKESGVGREESFEELTDYTHLRSTSVRLG